jgi:hypothetical protein
MSDTDRPALTKAPSHRDDVTSVTTHGTGVNV